MPHAIDLGCYPPSVPPDVEVVAPASALYDCLTTGRGQATATAQGCEVQLTQGFGTTGDVPSHRPQESRPSVARDSINLRHDLISPDEPLLDGHDQEEGCLSVRGSPECGEDRSGRCAHAGKVPAGQVIRSESSRLMNLNAGRGPRSGRLRDRHVQHLVIEAGESSHLQSGHSCDHSAGTCLEHCPPGARLPGQRTRVRRDRLPPRAPPPPRTYLCVDLLGRPPSRVKLASMQHTCLLAGQDARRVAPLALRVRGGGHGVPSSDIGVVGALARPQRPVRPRRVVLADGRPRTVEAWARQPMSRARIVRTASQPIRAAKKASTPTCAMSTQESWTKTAWRTSSTQW